MTKTVKLIFAFCLFIVQTSIGQINNPSFISREVSYCDVLKIEKNKSNTIIYFKYTAPSKYTNGGWVCAGNDFFIRDINTRTKYKLIKANNIPICPNKHNFQYKSQELEFNLVFEALPPSVDRIDIIEDETNGGFNFFGVNLTTQNSNYSSIQPSYSSEDCENIKYNTQSSKPDFTTMLAGVRFAIIADNPVTNHQMRVFNVLYEYLKGMGFENVEYLDKNYKTPKNLNEEILVSLGYTYNNEKFYNIKLTFYNKQMNYSWEFSTEKTAKEVPFSETEYNFGKVLRDMYGYKKNEFNSSYTMELTSIKTCWTEKKFKDYIQTKGSDELEGIYESINNSYNEPKYSVAVKKINEIYYLIYLSGATNNRNWIEGEVKAILEPTATSTFFKANWITANKTLDSNFYVTFESGLFNLISNDTKKELYVKLFPTNINNFNNSSTDLKSSGTGYAISSNGYIVTNHHVTNGANTIKIRGINNDFSKTYNAKVVVEDKNNDLSILQIDDPSFTTLGTIPYIIANRASDVGSSVFVLGYPLRATMGDEVKLTNGIISSKSGFQGDVTSYQITAPIQPGNSGGPLFDEKGNIIGVINAKHGGAENVSYAIKASYLMNLIDLMPTPPKLQAISIVAGKPLTEQVKVLKKFTYIIEIN